MGRKRKSNIELEYELERQIKDLKQEISKLKRKIREYEKKEKLDNSESENLKKQKNPTLEKTCPECNSKINKATLPFGYIEICSKGCGYKHVIKDKK